MEDYPEKRKYPDAAYASGSHQDHQQSKRSHQTSSNAVITINATMDIPNSKVGLVIGRKGTAIGAINERSGCRITIDGDNNQDPRKIYLQGTPENVSSAMQLISRIIIDGPSSLFPSAESGESDGSIVTVDDLYCPSNKVSLLIGAKGSTIVEIMKRSSCKVYIIQDGVPDQQDRPVSFKGTVEQIEEAKKLVRLVIEEGPGALGIPDLAPLVEERDIQPKLVGLLIGPKGSTLAEVCKKSKGCKIIVNQKFPEGQPHKVVYTGTAEQIKTAISIVEMIVNSSGTHSFTGLFQKDNSNAYGNYSTNPYGTSMGMGAAMGMQSFGSNFKSSNSQNFGLQQFPPYSQELTLYQSQVQRIMGPNGSMLQDMQQRYNVKVVFELLSNNSSSSTGDLLNSVTVYGLQEDVIAAVKMIYHMIGVAMPDGNASTSSAVGHSSHSSSAGSVSTSTGSTVPQPSPMSLALGADGSAGFLEPAVALPDGMRHQIAEVRNDSIGKIIGKGSGTIILIKSKSGANLVIHQDRFEGRNNAMNFTKVSIIGSQQCVQMATQMIQEVLVSGVGKLYHMSDVPCSVPGNYSVPSVPSNMAMPLSIQMPMQMSQMSMYQQQHQQQPQMSMFYGNNAQQQQRSFNPSDTRQQNHYSKQNSGTSNSRGNYNKY